MRAMSSWLRERSVTSANRSSDEMVMSAISRAMAAPVEMAMPASASDRAGESFTPSPIMMTLRPAAFSLRTNAALSSGRTSA